MIPSIHKLLVFFFWHAIAFAIRRKPILYVFAIASVLYSKRQTSPRIKGRHLKENCCSPRWRSFIYEAYSILPGHLREAAFQPMLHQFRSAPAHFAEPKADSGTDLSRSPSPFQSGCRSRCWPERRPAYWRQFFLPITNGLMLRSARLLLSSRRPSSRYLVRYGHCSRSHSFCSVRLVMTCACSCSRAASFASSLVCASSNLALFASNCAFSC